MTKELKRKKKDTKKELKKTSTGVTLFDSTRQSRPRKPRQSKKKSCRFCH